MSSPTEKKTGRPRSSLACLRLLIVGDQPRVRQSLDALFTALAWSASNHTAFSIKVVGEAGDSQQAVAQVNLLHPHVIVFDLPTQNPTNQGPSPGETPDSIAGSTSDGLSAIRIIKRRWPSVRIVVLTMYAADRSAVLGAGADTFLLKGCPAGELLDAVIAVAP